MDLRKASQLFRAASDARIAGKARTADGLRKQALVQAGDGFETWAKYDTVVERLKAEYERIGAETPANRERREKLREQIKAAERMQTRAGQ